MNTYLFKWVKKITQSCPILCNPMNDMVHGILQARILEWVAFPFSRESSQTRDRTQVSHIAGRFLTSWAIREVHMCLNNEIKPGYHIRKFKCAKNTEMINVDCFWMFIMYLHYSIFLLKYLFIISSRKNHLFVN